MFRDGTDPDAPYVAVFQNPNGQVEMQWRDSAGADSDWNGGQVGDTVNAKWVKLVRSGDTFSASYASTTGTPTASDWVLLATHTLAMCGIFTSAPPDSQSGAAPAERPAPRPAPRWPLRRPAAALPRPLAAARYLHYRVKLTPTSASLTAALYDTTFVWDLIVKNTSARRRWDALTG
jgi:hypothetical protein